jgi:hypothetical protein
MLRINVEIDGASHGDLSRMLKHIAGQIVTDEGGEGEGEYTTGFGDGPEAPYFYRVITINEES